MNNDSTSIRIWTVRGERLFAGERISNAVEALNRGDILILKNGLQAVNLWDEGCEILRKSLRKIVGRDRARFVEGVGLEHLHHHLNADETARLNDLAHERFNRWTRKMVPVLVREGIGYNGPGFFDRNAVIRFFLPHSDYVAGKSAFEKRPGYTKPQGLHIDSWFGHATAGLNFWIALRPVRRGHGLAIYPDKWGKPFLRGADTKPADYSGMGFPITFDLDVGDTLVFHGEHVHSSELNSTELTRVVLTNRFCVSQPIVTEKESMAQWQPLPKARPARQQELQQLGTSQTVGEFRASYADPDTHGSIEVIDAAWCRVTDGGVSRTVGRFCTHEGADLSCGYLQNGRLYCPFHHLHFDPATGKAPHDGFKPLKMPA